MANWMTKLTSISSVLMHVFRGMGSDTAAEVELVCGDGSREPGEIVDVEGWFSSKIREVTNI